MLDCVERFECNALGDWPLELAELELTPKDVEWDWSGWAPATEPVWGEYAAPPVSHGQRLVEQHIREGARKRSAAARKLREAEEAEKALKRKRVRGSQTYWRGLECEKYTQRWRQLQRRAHDKADHRRRYEAQQKQSEKYRLGLRQAALARRLALIERYEALDKVGWFVWKPDPKNPQVLTRQLRTESNAELLELGRALLGETIYGG